MRTVTTTTTLSLASVNVEAVVNQGTLTVRIIETPSKQATVTKETE